MRTLLLGFALLAAGSAPPGKADPPKEETLDEKLDRIAREINQRHSTWWDHSVKSADIRRLIEKIEARKGVRCYFNTHAELRPFVPGRKPDRGDPRWTRYAEFRLGTSTWKRVPKEQRLTRFIPSEIVARIGQEIRNRRKQK